MPPFPDFEGPSSYVRIHVISPLSMVAGRTVFSCSSVRANDCGKTVEQETTNGRGSEREIICESGPKALNESNIWRVGEREGHICPHPSNPTAAGEQPLDPNKWHNSESPQTVANHFLLSLANTTITHIMNHQWFSESPIGLQLTSWQ